MTSALRPFLWLVFQPSQMVYWWTKLFLLLNLAASLVTGMIDKFYGLIAYSLDFPWLACLFPGFSFPLFLPWKLNKTKGNHRKPKEIKGNHPAPNQRKPKKIKGNPKKPKDTLLGRMHVPVISSDVTKDFLWVKSAFLLLNVADFPDKNWGRSQVQREIKQKEASEKESLQLDVHSQVVYQPCISHIIYIYIIWYIYIIYIIYIIIYI